MWSLMGSMNRRLEGFDRRLDGVERQMVSLREDLGGRFQGLESRMTTGFGALKESIEARDFRLDEHGRRLSELERSRT
jgi:hypothetical protein